MSPTEPIIIIPIMIADNENIMLDEAPLLDKP